MCPINEANATEMHATIPVVVASCMINSIVNINRLKNNEILNNGNLNPSEAFQFLVIRLWMMRRTTHTADAQRTNTRFSGHPNPEKRKPLATPQPMTPSQVKKIFIFVV